VDFFRAVVLGVLQGLTEFLPISSSAHLAIFPKFFGWDDPGAAYTAVIQIGTELAVLLYFWRDIWTIGSGWVRGVFSSQARRAPEWRMGWFVIIGSLPIVVLGLLLQDAIDREFRNLWVIGTTLIVLGVVLGIAERVGRKSSPIEDLSMQHAILLGVAQAGALVPGVSRSGATISMGLFLGYERAAATRYAFLLAIPAVVGAGVFKLKDISGDNSYGTGGHPLAAQVRQHPLVHAVRHLPGRPRRAGAGAGRRRRDHRGRRGLGPQATASPSA
jgi:undecaprenyl-diphosphatase